MRTLTYSFNFVWVFSLILMSKTNRDPYLFLAWFVKTRLFLMSAISLMHVTDWKRRMIPEINIFRVLTSRAVARLWQAVSREVLLYIYLSNILICCSWTFDLLITFPHFFCLSPEDTRLSWVLAEYRSLKSKIYTNLSKQHSTDNITWRKENDVGYQGGDDVIVRDLEIMWALIKFIW